MSQMRPFASGGRRPDPVVQEEQTERPPPKSRNTAFRNEPLHRSLSGPVRQIASKDILRGGDRRRSRMALCCAGPRLCLCNGSPPLPEACGEGRRSPAPGLTRPRPRGLHPRRFVEPTDGRAVHAVKLWPGTARSDAALSGRAGRAIVAGQLRVGRPRWRFSTAALASFHTSPPIGSLRERML